MIESLLNFKEVDRSPYLIFLWGLIVSTIGILISTQLYYKIQISNTVINLSGIFSVLFTIIPSTYFLTLFIKKEEKIEEEEIKTHQEKKFWSRHEKEILIFLFYFLGVTFSFALWSFILPTEYFQIQMAKIQEIRTNIATGLVVSKGNFNTFTNILINNLQVTGFAFIFSLLFGCGAIFIIVWNASVLGVYIGELSKSFYEIPIVSLSFLPHGIPEICGFLCAGLAGGLLSSAIIRNRGGKVIEIIFFDCLKILLLSIFFIFIAALIEVYL
jgi:uncharacterized membrane protein SpoIIM required for sporulation